MKRTDLPPILQSMLKRVPFATIATVCPDGQPWNSPVFARLDEETLELYWVSWLNNQHSQNIARDPRIFVVIYDSRLVPFNKRQGLYMRMQARPLTNRAQLKRIREKFLHAFGEAADESAFTGKNPRRIYKAVPQQIWTNQDGQVEGHFVDVRRELGKSQQ